VFDPNGRQTRINDPLQSGDSIRNRGFVFAFQFEMAVVDLGKRIQGKLLVSGFNFARAIESADPAGIFLFDQLVRYGVGPDFNPAASLPAEALKSKATK
jgi:hypothetical protein